MVHEILKNRYLQDFLKELNTSLKAVMLSSKHYALDSSEHQLVQRLEFQR